MNIDELVEGVECTPTKIVFDNVNKKFKDSLYMVVTQYGELMRSGRNYNLVTYDNLSTAKTQAKKKKGVVIKLNGYEVVG